MAVSSQRDRKVACKRTGKMMDKLLNEKEASEYLGISEDELKELVQQKRIPAYKIAGQFLRFDLKDLDALKKEKDYSLFSRLKDYIYYNDFYIIVAILILILLALVFKASF